MWNSETKNRYLFEMPDDKKELVEQVKGFSNLPSSGVCIIFDSTSYDEYPMFRGLGFHANIKKNHIVYSPPEIYNIMISCEYSNFIWISGKATQKDKIHLAWILAHELRHLEHDMISNTLSKSGYFIYNTLSQISTSGGNFTLNVPTELDCELRAWRVVKSIFGDEETKLYMKKRIITEAHKKNYELLSQNNPDIDYDVTNAVIKFLRKHQIELEKIQEITEDKNLKEFNISKSCNELQELINNRIVKVII